MSDQQDAAAQADAWYAAHAPAAEAEGAAAARRYRPPPATVLAPGDAPDHPAEAASRFIEGYLTSAAGSWSTRQGFADLLATSDLFKENEVRRLVGDGLDSGLLDEADTALAALSLENDPDLVSWREDGSHAEALHLVSLARQGPDQLIRHFAAEPS